MHVGGVRSMHSDVNVGKHERCVCVQRSFVFWVVFLCTNMFLLNLSTLARFHWTR